METTQLIWEQICPTSSSTSDSEISLRTTMRRRRNLKFPVITIDLLNAKKKTFREMTLRRATILNMEPKGPSTVSSLGSHF